MFTLVQRYIKNYIPELVGNITFVALQIIFQTVFVIGEMPRIIDNGVAQGNMDLVIHSGIRMLFFTIVSGLCTIAASYLSARITASIT